MRRTLLTLTVALTLALPASAQAQAFSTLEERMNATEFRNAGLEKLSADELAALNAWLQANGTRPATAAAGGDRRGLTEASSDDTRGPVSSRLVGESTGWSYGTVFRLENGQVWRSVDRNSRLAGIRISNPSVVIRRGLMGNWRLKFDDYNATTQVERVE